MTIGQKNGTMKYGFDKKEINYLLKKIKSKWERMKHLSGNMSDVKVGAHWCLF